MTTSQSDILSMRPHRLIVPMLQAAICFAIAASCSDNRVSQPTATAAPTSLITTVAGSRLAFSGDNGPADQANLNGPDAIAVDATGQHVHRRCTEPANPKGRRGLERSRPWLEMESAAHPATADPRPPRSSRIHGESPSTRPARSTSRIRTTIDSARSTQPAESRRKPATAQPDSPATVVRASPPA